MDFVIWLDDTKTITTGGGVDATATPGAVTSSSTVTAPAPSGDSNIAAGAVTSTGTIAAPTISGSSSVAPGVLSSTATLLSPTETGSSNATPASATTTATIFAPSLSAGSLASPIPVVSSGILFAPIVSGDSFTAVGVLAATSVIPNQSPSGDANVVLGLSPGTGTLVATATLLSPTLSVSAIIIADASSVLSNLFAPGSLTGTATVSPDPIAGLSNILAVTVTVAAHIDIYLRWSDGSDIALQWDRTDNDISLSWSDESDLALTWDPIMAVEQNFSFFPGMDITLHFTTQSPPVGGIGAYTFDLSIYTSEGGSLFFNKTAGFVVDDAAGGEYHVPLDRSETLPFSPQHYYYEVRQTNPGDNTVLTYGQIRVLP